MNLKRRIPPFTFLLFFLCAGYSGISQSFSFEIDHYAMIVKDISKTGEFYKEVLGLKDIPHPGNADGFRWFAIDGRSQLHLIQKDQVPEEKSKSTHLCLSIDDLTAFINYLKENKISFWDWPGTLGAITDRADGVRQIYLQDPEGNWIEINDAGK
jgi:catechol 2,3-dioxygenase-like lactoylglutathione lyase family enzyme